MLFITSSYSNTEELQQLLPFTVLKPTWSLLNSDTCCWLQQLLPFTVLKPFNPPFLSVYCFKSCNSSYRLRYWNLELLAFYHCRLGRLQQLLPFTVLKPTEAAIIINISRCNSSYRLRYWNNIILDANKGSNVTLQQLLPFTVLKLYVLMFSYLLHKSLQQLLPFTVLKLATIFSCNVIL